MMEVFTACLLLFLAYPTSGQGRKCVEVTCSSRRFKKATCGILGVPFNPTNTKITLKKQHSRSVCAAGRTYGVKDKKVFVTRGCRGTFDVCYNNGAAPAAAAAVAAAALKAAGTKYIHLGCFNDKSNRAIKGAQTNYAADKVIRECFERAKREKNQVFAVQYKTQCFTSKDAVNTYAKYGKTGDNRCRDGRGGTWTMDVYKIAGASSAGAAATGITAGVKPDSLWEHVDGKLKVISVGDGKMVGVNSRNQIFFRLGVTETNPKGTSWEQLPGSLKSIATGDGKIGGANRHDNIYFRTGVTESRPDGSNWQHISGKLKQLDIGDNMIIGVNSDDRIYYRTGIDDRNPLGTDWLEIGGRLKHVSVGDGIIIGVNSANDIYYRTGISKSNPYGTGWNKLDGSLKEIEAGGGKIVGVNTENKVFERIGISPDKPLGTSWKEIPGRLKYISTDTGRIMGVSPDDSIVSRKGIKGNVGKVTVTNPGNVGKVTVTNPGNVGKVTVTNPVAELCPKEQGFCVKANGHDQNSGVYKDNARDGNTDFAQVDCLNKCLNYVGATGCEVIWNQGNRGCYIHTQEVARGNNARNHYCWILSKCKGGAGIVPGQGPPVTVPPIVRPKPALAETIFGTPSVIQEDYVNFKVEVNDNMGFPVSHKTFGPAHTCPDNKAITGFRLRFKDIDQPFQSKLTGVEMICQDGTILGPDTVKDEGVWEPWVYCDNVETKDTPNFVIGFNYRAANHMGGKQLKMKCSNGAKQIESGVNIGNWFVGQDYSGCSTSGKFCGFSAELGYDYIGRMKFLCCSPAPTPLAADGDWVPFATDVCFGARDENYGFFTIPDAGFLTGLRFVYIEGTLTCNVHHKQLESKFGCTYGSHERAFSVFVTDSNKGVILPDHNQLTSQRTFYNVIGKDARFADEFTLKAANPTYVPKNAELRIYYGEDLYNHHEGDNVGKVCVHVYGTMLA